MKMENQTQQTQNTISPMINPVEPVSKFHLKYAIMICIALLVIAISIVLIIDKNKSKSLSQEQKDIIVKDLNSKEEPISQSQRNQMMDFLNKN